MKRKKIGSDVEIKKLLNELSVNEAVKVKGGDAPIELALHLFLTLFRFNFKL